jgi:hypothetical protein
VSGGKEEGVFRGWQKVPFENLKVLKSTVLLGLFSRYKSSKYGIFELVMAMRREF